MADNTPTPGALRAATSVVEESDSDSFCVYWWEEAPDRVSSSHWLADMIDRESGLRELVEVAQGNAEILEDLGKALMDMAKHSPSSLGVPLHKYARAALKLAESLRAALDKVLKP